MGHSRRDSDQSNDLKSFFQQNPDVNTIEVLLPDANGVLRGKWVSSEGVEKIYSGGFKMPYTALGLDIWGRDIDELVFESGDADGICLPVEGSLKRVPWMKNPTGQVMVSMANSDGAPYAGDPRAILQRVLSLYREKGLQPVVATELEFYLFKADRALGEEPEHPMVNRSGECLMGGHTYSIDMMRAYADLFHEIRAACQEQDLPVDTLIKESAPSQFEINLKHVSDAVLAADHAIGLKRIIKGVALNHGLMASFMAKPFGALAGNGFHIHFSLLDAQGNNVFDDGGDAGSEALKSAVAGLLETMPEVMAVFAPNLNSYRRFQRGSHAPMSPAWGYENRTTAIRIPEGNGASRRIEHRLGGADANPYLTLATLLAGAYHGISNDLKPPSPIEGDAYRHQGDKALPVQWAEALALFRQSEFVKTYLGDTFQRVYSLSKQQELEEFNRHVTALEYDSYLALI